MVSDRYRAELLAATSSALGEDVSACEWFAPQVRGRYDDRSWLWYAATFRLGFVVNALTWVYRRARVSGPFPGAGRFWLGITPSTLAGFKLEFGDTVRVRHVLWAHPLRSLTVERLGPWALSVELDGTVLPLEAADYSRDAKAVIDAVLGGSAGQG